MNSAARLLERAQGATSLTDFGDDSFREGLEVLVGSADVEARLTELGRTMFDAQIVGFLSSRLQVEHWYALHLEIDGQLGLPRSGSTASPRTRRSVRSATGKRSNRRRRRRQPRSMKIRA